MGITLLRLFLKLSFRSLLQRKPTIKPTTTKMIKTVTTHINTKMKTLLSDVEEYFILSAALFPSFSAVSLSARIVIIGDMLVDEVILCVSCMVLMVDVVLLNIENAKNWLEPLMA